MKQLKANLSVPVTWQRMTSHGNMFSNCLMKMSFDQWHIEGDKLCGEVRPHDSLSQGFAVVSLR
jgi:hypothetical protein